MTAHHRLFVSGLSAFFAASAAGLITGCAVPPTATTPNSTTPPAQTETLADTEPQNADAWARRGHRGLEQGRIDHARLDLDRALQLNPAHATALLDRATLRYADSDLAGALTDIDAANASRPDNARILGMRCVIRVSIDGTANGLADCDAALNLAGPSANAQVSRGHALLVLRRSEEALAAFEAALVAQPSHARALYGRGLARQRLGDAAGGEADVSEAVRRLPGAGREFAATALASS